MGELRPRGIWLDEIAMSDDSTQEASQSAQALVNECQKLGIVERLSDGAIRARVQERISLWIAASQENHSPSLIRNLAQDRRVQLHPGHPWHHEVAKNQVELQSGRDLRKSMSCAHRRDDLVSRENATKHLYDSRVVVNDEDASALPLEWRSTRRSLHRRHQIRRRVESRQAQRRLLGAKWHPLLLTEAPQSFKQRYRVFLDPRRSDGFVRHAAGGIQRPVT